MVYLNKKIIFFITGLFVLSGFLFLFNDASAATSTVKGKAYWGEYGYIYFDCSDDIIGNRLDEPNNFLGGTTIKEPPAAFGYHFYYPPCTNNMHSVAMDDNNFFSGEAWNPSFGFIDFSYSSTNTPPNYNFNTHCSSCTALNNCMACYDEANQTVHGWARVKSTSTNPWIQLDSPGELLTTQMRSGPLTPILAGYNIELGDFVGRAKAYSSTVFGNVSFNCEGETHPTSTCGIRNYKVYIKNLRFGRLSAPNWSYTNACESTALQAVLRWEKLSGTQSGYEILVRENNNLSTSTGFTCWTGGKIDSAAATQFIVSNSNAYCTGNGGVKYNTAYYWWVRGYDENGTPTPWYQYGNNSSADTDQNLDGRADTFQTFKHKFPNPFFSWNPLIVVAGSTGTVFTSESLVYETGNPTLPVSCEPGRCPFYEWATNDPSAFISATNSSTTLISFFNTGNASVSLKIRDVDNYECSIITSLGTINYELPLWREVKAK